MFLSIVLLVLVARPVLCPNVRVWCPTRNAMPQLNQGGWVFCSHVSHAQNLQGFSVAELCVHQLQSPFQDGAQARSGGPVYSQEVRRYNLANCLERAIFFE
jgi:hypothetical protein